MKDIDDILKKSCKNDIDVPVRVHYGIINALKNKSSKKRKKTIVFLPKVSTLAVALTFCVTVYAGFVNNWNFEEIGFFKLGENYSESSVSINKTIESEYYKITLENMAADSAYLVAEYKIELTDKALDEFNKIVDNGMGYNIGIYSDLLIDSKQIKEETTHVQKISDNQYRYIQIYNVMDIKKSNFDVELDLKNLYIGSIMKGGNQANIGKKIITSVELNRENESNIEQIEQMIDDNTKVIIEGITNAKFESFVKGKIITEGITYKEFCNTHRYPEYYSFIVTNENNEQIEAIVKNGEIINQKQYIKIDREYKEVEGFDNVKDSDIVKVEEDNVIIFNAENIGKVNILPIKVKCSNERTNEEADEYKNATWYPLIEGDKTYKKETSLGGIFEINKIDIDDENITFYYNQKGLIGNESKVLIRNANAGINFIYASKTEKKGINGNENKVVFSRDTTYFPGANTGYVDLSNLNGLEFTLLFGSRSKFVGNEMTLNIPNQNNETAKIKNTKIEDFIWGGEEKIAKTNAPRLEKYQVNNDIVKEAGRIKSSGLRTDREDGMSSYETDLLQNDMKHTSDYSMAYKVITNEDDYMKYKSRVKQFPDLTTSDFENSFIVIIANETARSYFDNDLIISNIASDSNTTHIIMKQKENPNEYNEKNIWYAVVNKSQLRDNIEIQIDYKKLAINGFKDIKQLPIDYSIEKAISDGCLVINNNKVISDNKELIDEFMEKSKNGEKSFIRIYELNIGNGVVIKDVLYENGIYYMCSDSTRNHIYKESKKYYYYTYNDIEKKESSSIHKGTHYNLKNIENNIGYKTINTGYSLVIIE